MAQVHGKGNVMILDFNENKPVAVLLGAGAMGLAIVRRVAAGAKVLLGDVSEENLNRAADALRFNGYDVETMVVNALSKDEVYAFAAKAAELGDVMWFVDTAGASPARQSHSSSSTSISLARAMRLTPSVPLWPRVAQALW